MKLDTPTVPAQGTAFATKGSETKSSKGAAAGGKYLKAAEWNALSSDEQQKIIESRSKSKGDDTWQSVYLWFMLQQEIHVVGHEGN